MRGSVVPMGIQPTKMLCVCLWELLAVSGSTAGMPFTERKEKKMKYFVSSSYTGKRVPIEINDDRTHDAARSTQTRLLWLRSDSQFPCGVVFARAERVSLGAEAIGKALNINALIGKGPEMDPDGQYRTAKAAIADAIRERSKAYFKVKGQRKLTHRLDIPPELLQ